MSAPLSKFPFIYWSSTLITVPSALSSMNVMEVMMVGVVACSSCSLRRMLSRSLLELPSSFFLTISFHDFSSNVFIAIPNTTCSPTFASTYQDRLPQWYIPSVMKCQYWTLRYCRDNPGGSQVWVWKIEASTNKLIAVGCEASMMTVRMWNMTRWADTKWVGTQQRARCS